MAGRTARVRPRASSACATSSGCPKRATFRRGRKSGAAGSPAPRRSSRRNGCCPTATTSGSSPSRCPTAACGCSSRTAPSSCGSPRRATPCCASAPRPSTICSRRSACSPATAGCTCGTAASSRIGSSTRNGSPSHPRVDELVPAMARKLVNPTAAAQIREMVRQTTNERQSASGRISMTDGRHFEFAAVPLPDGNALFTMVDVTDSTPDRGGASRARDGARGSRPGQDRLRRQHELRAAHAADLDRRLRRAARRRLCRRAQRQGATIMSTRSSNRSSGCRS